MASQTYPKPLAWTTDLAGSFECEGFVITPMRTGEWHLWRVLPDGRRISLGDGPFDTVEEAKSFAVQRHRQDFVTHEASEV